MGRLKNRKKERPKPTPMPSCGRPAHGPGSYGWEEIGFWGRFMGEGWFILLVIIIIGLVFFGLWKVSEGIELQREELTGKFAIKQVDLMFNSRIPDREVWVSEDMKQYIGWVFINQEIGACHIKETFQGFKKCLQVRGDPWRRKPRKIVATIISEDCLKEYFGVFSWREK